MPIVLPGYDEGFGIGLPVLRSVCVIISDFGIGHDGFAKRRHGTGFFFHSEGDYSYVLTAGHNIYNHELERFAREAGLWFGRYGDRSEASREMRKARVPEQFLSASHPDPRSDYGVVQVSKLGADRFVPFGLTKALSSGEVARMSGYPNDGPAKGSFRPFYSDIYPAPSGADNFSYGDNRPSYVGQSGAPLLLASEGKVPEACGLHVRDRGIAQRAVRFNNDVFAQLDAWV